MVTPQKTGWVDHSTFDYLIAHQATAVWRFGPSGHRQSTSDVFPFDAEALTGSSALMSVCITAIYHTAETAAIYVLYMPFILAN